MRHYGSYFLFLLALVFFTTGCGNKRSDFVATAGVNNSNIEAAPETGNNDVVATGTLQLNLSFSELAAGQLVAVAEPTGVQNLVFRLARQDRTDLLKAKSIPLSGLNARSFQGQGISRQVSFSEIPLNTFLLLRVEALDGEGKRLYDFEKRVRVSQSEESLAVVLTPVDGVRSAVFYTLPFLLVTPDVAEQVAAFLADETDPDVFLIEDVLGYKPSPCSGWSLEIGDQVFTIEPDGRLRVPLSALGAASAVLRHPTDKRLSSVVELSELGNGQFTDKGLVLAFRFDGGCGMDERTVDSEFCGQPIGTEPIRALLEILAQAARVVPVLPASVNAVNVCNQVVPGPTQFEIRARGHYPQPKEFLSDGSVKLSPVQEQCEQTNGGFHGLRRPGVAPGEVVETSERGALQDYLFSTCHRYVAFGCCPNENQLASIANTVFTIAPVEIVNVGYSLSNFFFGTRERGLLTPTVSFTDKLSCPDNHGGRQCQELIIGDVSLDFTASGKGGIQFPLDQELRVSVEPGEVVPFVIHNNGCYIDTVVTSTKQEIKGDLRRTFKEFAISPVVESTDPKVPKLQVSTDPLLGGVPTSGTKDVTPATLARNFTPTAPGFVGFGGVTRKVRHAEIDESIAVSPSSTNFRRYRYFCDVAATYTTPVQALPGKEDRFLFTVDGCTVPVTFVVVGDPKEPPSTEPPLTPPSATPSPTQTPEVTNVNLPLAIVDENHIVGSTPCPQQLAEIPIGNATAEPVSVTIQASPPLFVDSPSFTLAANTGVAVPAIFFDCSTTTSFSSSVTITATSSAGTQVITIPVNLNIEI